jgi:hypothetical protein
VVVAVEEAAATATIVAAVLQGVARIALVHSIHAITNMNAARYASKRVMLLLNAGIVSMKIM